ncbi:hypothetical protein P3W55_13325 [Pseudomonas citronellolis]|uniref:Uncharacterized protein n=1 Tax=Pseudomonas citronellolis TaxID=53408 RepID=A0AAW6P4Q7_9PSED|nr:hypothetical protein [Pseudomonas citronellolis]MDF3842691.1 hypothetical protein [Pseudomonas citronellolis]
MSNQFTLSDSSLRSLAAQLQLNGKFRHSCRSAYGRRFLDLTMQVEQAASEAAVLIEAGGERHRITISHREPRGDITLADFIEAIANGRIDSAEPAPARTTPALPQPDSLVDTAQQQALRDLVRKGGFLDVHVGLEHPVKVAVHRTYNTQGITALLSLGEAQPRTSAWTLHQAPAKCFQALLESVEHLAASGMPKARRAA